MMKFLAKRNDSDLSGDHKTNHDNLFIYRAQEFLRHLILASHLSTTGIKDTKLELEMVLNVLKISFADVYEWTY